MDIKRISKDIENGIAKARNEHPEMVLQAVFVAPPLFEALRASGSHAATGAAKTHSGNLTMPMFGTKVVQLDNAERDDAWWVSLVKGTGQPGVRA